MAALGRLVITLSANIAEFTGAMDKASFVADQRSRAIARSIDRTVAFAGKALAGAASVIGLAVQKALANASQLTDLSQSIGMNVEAFQGLALAASQSGVSTEDFRNAMVKLQQAVADNSPALAAMGIAVQDANGNLKSTEEVLFAVSNKFASYRDGAGKTALATDLLGKSGAKMVPVFNQGEEALREFIARAKEMGLILSADTIKQADDFADKLDLIKVQALAIAGNFTDGLIPQLDAVARGFSFGTTKAEAWREAGEKVGDWIKRTIAGLTALGGVLEASGLRLMGYAKAWSLVFKGDFKGAQNAIAASLEESLIVMGRALDKAGVMLEAGRASEIAKAREAAAEELRIKEEKDKALKDKNKPNAPSAGDFTKAQKEAADKAKELAGIIKQVDEAYRSLAFTQDEIIIQNARLAGASDAVIADLESKLLATQLLKNQQEMEIKTNEDINTTLADQKALRESLPELYYNVASASEKYRIDLEKILDLEQKLIVAGAKYEDIQKFKAAALVDLAEKYKPVAKNAAELAQVIGTAFEDAILSGRSLSDVLKALADDILRIIIRATVTAPLQEALTGALSNAGGSFWKNILGFIGIKSGTAATPAPTTPTNFSGPRALGGPVLANRSYLVGERGPELFMPFNSGQIVPNDRLAAERRSPIVRQVFNITTPNADSFRLSQRQIARRARGFVSA
jgi:hypothetical protein